MDFELKIEGAEELERTLQAMGRTPARRLGSFAVRKAADVIVERAKELCPVATGELRKSIGSVAARAGDDEVARHIGWARPRGRIAHLVEFGTVRTQPQPHMRPALDEKAAEAFGKLGEEVGKAIIRDAERFATRRTSGR